MNYKHLFYCFIDVIISDSYWSKTFIVNGIFIRVKGDSDCGIVKVRQCYKGGGGDIMVVDNQELMEISLLAYGGEKGLSAGTLLGSPGGRLVASMTVSGMTSKTMGLAIREFF